MLGTIGELEGLNTTGAGGISNIIVTSNNTSGSANVVLNSIGRPISVGNTGTLNVAASNGKSIALTLNGNAYNTGGAQTYGATGTIALTLANNVTLDTTDFGLNSSPSAITVNGTINGARALTIDTGSATTTLNGLVGGTTALASLAINGASVIGTSAVTTTGTQIYNGATILNAVSTTLAGSTVTFTNTLDGNGVLVVSGNASFGGNVGTGTAFTSLGVAGTTTIAAQQIETGGTQTYTGAVTLTGLSLQLDASTVSFGSTVDGGDALEIIGAANFAGTVGGLTALGNLTVLQATTLQAGVGSVTTTGGQDFGGGLTLLGNVALTSTEDGSMLFTGNVSGAGRMLSVSSGAGFVNFDGVTVGALNLATGSEMLGTGTYAIGAAGSAYTFNGSSGVTLLGTLGVNNALTFGSALTLGSSSTINAGTNSITFGSTIDGHSALTVNTTGMTTFDAKVGNSTRLASLSVSGATTFFGAPFEEITTTGNQTYTGAVTINTNTEFVVNNGSGTATFGATVDSAPGASHNLIVFGNATLGGSVGAAVGMNGVSVTKTATFAGTNVTVTTNGGLSTGNQSYGSIVLGAGTSTTLQDSTGGTIQIGTPGAGNAVTGAGALTTFTNGNITGTQFLGNVGTSTMALTSLNVTGLTFFNSSATQVFTSGAQSYGATSVNANMTFTVTGTGSGGISFASIGQTAGTGLGATVIAGANGTATFGGVNGSTAFTHLTVSGSKGANFTGPVKNLGTLNVSTGTGGASFAGLGVSTFSLSTGGTETLNAGTYSIGNGDTFGSATIPVITNGALVFTGATAFNGAVTLGSDTSMNAGANTIGFVSTIDGAHALTVASTAGSSFAGAIGGQTALTSLGVSGPTTLSGGSVSTTAGQTYSGAATLGANTILKDTSAGGVDFVSTLDSDNTAGTTNARNLTVSGNATFGGAVGSLYKLGTLAVTGTTAISGGSIATVGTQSYGPLNLTSNTALTTSNALITLGQVSGAGDTLTISTGTGGVTFGGLTLAAIDLSGTTGTETLNTGTYDITAGGNFGTVSLGGTLTFLEATNFSGATTLTADTVINDGTNGVSFVSTLDGAHALTVSGNASFGGAVGSATMLTSIGVTGTTALNGGSVKTTGAQTYSGATRSAPTIPSPAR